MSKAKLDKGDQQLEMVGNYVIAFFKGIAVGIKRIIKEKDKMMLFIIVTLISGVIFYLREQIGSYIAPDTEFHVIKLALLLTPTLPIFLLYTLGQENKGSTEDFEAKFAAIKFCGKDGKYPIFKGKKVDGKKVIYSFSSPGINLFEWLNRQVELETVLDCNIVKIETAKKTKQLILLHAVPSDQGISENLLWNDSFIREKDFVLCVGIAILEDVEIDLNKYPHALIAGVTGSGKSVILRSMLWQCIKKGAKIYMVDFKGGVEFGLDYEAFGEVVTEREATLELLKQITKEMRLRIKAFRQSGVKEIVPYNQLHPNNTLCRIVIVCDEVSEMLDKTGLSKNEQVIYDEIARELSSIARLGRAQGINMLLATQRPDAKVIPGQIKNNLPIRISGRMVDEQASKMVLGNTKASQLGDTRGRFMYTVGADTYEFQAFNFKDDSLVKGNYQIGSMLLEQGNNGKNALPDSEFDESEEEYQLLDYEPNLEGEKFDDLDGF